MTVTQSYYVPGLTRSHGDSGGVTNMDIGIDDVSLASSLGRVISTGIGKEIGAFKIIVQSGANIGAAAAVDLHGTQTYDLYTGAVLATGNGTDSQMQPGGAVEAILKVLEQKVTILAYQVENNTSGEISVIFEQTAAWSASFYGQSGTGNSNASGMIAPTNSYGSVVADLQSAIQALGQYVGYQTTVAGTTTNHYVDVRQTIVVNAGTPATNTAEAQLSAPQFGTSITFA